MSVDARRRAGGREQAHRLPAPPHQGRARDGGDRLDARAAAPGARRTTSAPTSWPTCACCAPGWSAPTGWPCSARCWPRSTTRRSCWRSSASAWWRRAGASCAPCWRPRGRAASYARDANLEVAVNALVGAFFARYLAGDSLGGRFVATLVDTVLDGLLSAVAHRRAHERDEHRLQGQAREQRRAPAGHRVALGVLGHPHVGGEDRDERRDQPPAGDPPRRRAP